MVLYIFFKISAHNYEKLRATPPTPWFYLKVETTSMQNIIIMRTKAKFLNLKS